jgi:predicted membrane metal-binding protein
MHNKEVVPNDAAGYLQSLLLGCGEESASNSANSSLVNNFYLADNMTTIAATLATAPSSLWHFHQFSPAGLLTNLFPIPLIA